MAVGLTLLLFTCKAGYPEIKLADLARRSHTVLSIFTGLLVFVLWIHMDWPFAVFGKPEGFNPTFFKTDTQDPSNHLEVNGRCFGCPCHGGALLEIFSYTLRSES